MKRSADVLVVGSGVVGCSIACFLRKRGLEVIVLGRVPSWENVALACGHGGFGITMSAITGEALADLIATGQAPAVIGPFAPRAG